jgi:chromosomal replication initiation ATPase DnaA
MSRDDNKFATTASGQMAFDLPVGNFVGRDDIIEGPANKTALEMVDRWPHWPGNLVILAGPIGSGKSHIASIWAGRADARCVNMNAIAQLGEDRANWRSLLLEDAEVNGINETELFHVLNAKRAANATIIITSRSWPSSWGIELADLNSRLRAAQLVELGEPDDELLRKVLFKLFADRQLVVEPQLVDYLVVRMERSLEAAHKIVERLDSMALAQNRKITRHLAGEVLAAMEIGSSGS